MALVKCSRCGEQISDRSNACIHCGASVVKLEVMQELEKQQKYSEELQLQNEQLKNDYNYELTRREEENKNLENQNQNLINELNNEKIQREQFSVEKEKLMRELAEVREKNDKLESKLDNTRKEKKKNVSLKISNLFVNLIDICRYLIAIMFSISSIAFLASGDYKSGFPMLLFSVALYPFVYKFVWKKKNVSILSKVVIQFVSPIVVLILLLIILGG